MNYFDEIFETPADEPRALTAEEQAEADAFVTESFEEGL